MLFNAFEGPPRIVRLFGTDTTTTVLCIRTDVLTGFSTGTYHEFGSPEYDALITPETRRPGSRAAVVIDVHKVGSSCGHAVPYYEFKGHRQVLLDFFAKREEADRTDVNAHGEKGLKDYWEENKHAHRRQSANLRFAK
ncbi:hypothetical protein C2E23DRAFT_548495 [Lenzites betulinus]|nr:hypothetical protein C2E23DRAFT_548495 [Lenzites betulinus]